MLSSGKFTVARVLFPFAVILTSISVSVETFELARIFSIVFFKNRLHLTFFVRKKTAFTNEFEYPRRIESRKTNFE